MLATQFKAFKAKEHIAEFIEKHHVIMEEQVKGVKVGKNTAMKSVIEMMVGIDGSRSFDAEDGCMAKLVSCYEVFKRK